MRIQCPCCGEQYSVETGFADYEGKRLAAQFVEMEPRLAASPAMLASSASRPARRCGRPAATAADPARACWRCRSTIITTCELWCSVLPAIRNRPSQLLRYEGLYCVVEALQWLNADQARRVIESLKQWAGRVQQ
ncbi:hypothetical protein GCM10027514_32700 [Azotobacter armeniacus]